MARFIHIPFNQREFSRWAGAKNRGLVNNRFVDVGLAMHILLTSVFSKGTVQPYRVMSSARRSRGSFYAYTNATTDELVGIANLVIGPDSAGVLDLDAMSSRALPVVEADQRVGFDIKVRPTRRSNGHEADACLMHGREWVDRDSYSSCDNDRVTTSIREKTYSKWLAERLRGVADVNMCRLAHFRKSRAAFGRNRNAIHLPDATLHGDMTVLDPVAFQEKLRTGIGRHKAYGYGMILLRPPAAVG